MKCFILTLTGFIALAVYSLYQPVYEGVSKEDQAGLMRVLDTPLPDELVTVSALDYLYFDDHQPVRFPCGQLCKPRHHKRG